MKQWFKTLDDILRGRETHLLALKDGQLDLPVRELLPLLIQLGAFYGFCMGWYAIFNHGDPKYMQIWAGLVKVPMLFMLTFAVTLPSLYIFNTLVGSRLTFGSLVSLLVASMAVSLAVLASFGPIVAFFSLTTTSYPFMKLFNVLVFAISSGLGLAFLFQTLHRLTLSQQVEAGKVNREVVNGVLEQRVSAPSAVLVEMQHAGNDELSGVNGYENGDGSTDDDDTGTNEHRELGALARIRHNMPQRHVHKVFYCWVVLFAVVGGQMSWVLRPFIGQPGVPFEWLRPRTSNFAEAIWEALVALLS